MIEESYRHGFKSCYSYSNIFVLGAINIIIESSRDVNFRLFLQSNFSLFECVSQQVSFLQGRLEGYRELFGFQVSERPAPLLHLRAALASWSWSPASLARLCLSLFCNASSDLPLVLPRYASNGMWPPPLNSFLSGSRFSGSRSLDLVCVAGSCSETSDARFISGNRSRLCSRAGSAPT